jgi:hypothetical protein
MITRLMARPDCCMAQGTAKIEVPIIVFQIDNLKKKTTTIRNIRPLRGVISEIFRVRQNQWVGMICPPPLIEIGLTYKVYIF